MCFGGLPRSLPFRMCTASVSPGLPMRPLVTQLYTARKQGCTASQCGLCLKRLVCKCSTHCEGSWKRAVEFLRALEQLKVTHTTEEICYKEKRWKCTGNCRMRHAIVAGVRTRVISDGLFRQCHDAWLDFRGVDLLAQRHGLKAWNSLAAHDDVTFVTH